MKQDEYSKSIAKFGKNTLKPSFSAEEGPQHAANIIASHLQSSFSGYSL
jgi:hypothetical protein